VSHLLERYCSSSYGIKIGRSGVGLASVPDIIAIRE
jgi:hypothetical protein